LTGPQRTPPPSARIDRGFLKAFRSLRRRNYRLFWFGQMISMIGMWAGEVALAWLVLSLTDSPAILGLSVTIRFLPSTVLCPFGGILADRFAKRSLLMVTQSLQLLLALALAVSASTGLISITVVFILAALRGVLDALDVPARQAFVVEMVGTQDVGNAVALNSLQFNVARIAGPVVGAALITVLGIASSFYLNAATFLVVVCFLFAIKPSQLNLAPQASKAPVVRQLRDVFSYCYRTPDIIVIFLLVSAIGTFGYNFMTILPLLARYVLDSGPTGLGALTSSLGVGSMIAAVWMAYRGVPTRRLMLSASVVFAVLLVAMGLSPWQWLTMLILVGLGLSAILFITTANTRLQLLAPGELRGRVMGVYTWLFMGTAPLGALIVGWLAEWTGVQPMVLQTAGVYAVLVAGALWYARKNRTRLVKGLSGTGASAAEPPVDEKAA